VTPSPTALLSKHLSFSSRVLSLMVESESKEEEGVIGMKWVCHAGVVGRVNEGGEPRKGS